jgi:UDP-glucuronate 4-epimerase
MILVTGAAGFIGAHVARRLANDGRSVLGCDNFNDYYPSKLKIDRVEQLLTPLGVTCKHVELKSVREVTELFSERKITKVIHLAAQAGVRYSLQNPAAYIDSNIVAFANILEQCRHSNIEHLVYASSSSVYGTNSKLPFHEDDRCDEPVSLYAATKRANELMAHTYAHLFGLRCSGLRFFTVYGPWGRPDMAYWIFTEKLLRREPLPVFADGLLKRDFTYVDDVVEGVVRLLNSPSLSDSPTHELFNIGNHKPVVVLEFIRALEDILGVKANLEFRPMQPGDVPATYADIDKLNARTGFAPRTQLSEGLRRFADWFRAYHSMA